MSLTVLVAASPSDYFHIALSRREFKTHLKAFRPANLHITYGASLPQLVAKIELN